MYQKERGSIFSINGDEILDGPFYNYARGGTWSYLANTIIQGYENVLFGEQASISNPANTVTPERFSGHLVEGSVPLSRRTSVSAKGLTGTAIDVDAVSVNFDPAPSHLASEYGHLLQQDPHHQRGSVDLQYMAAMKKCKFSHTGPMPRLGWKADPTLQELKTQIWINKFIAFGISAVLQGVTGWSAFMIAYRTPTIGIGCRSFVYMLYTLVSLFCCILFMLGSYFSETECHRREVVALGHSEEAEVKSSNFIAALGVGCRCLGKVLAILNAVLIIMSNLFEFTGVYQSCFCKSSYIQLRS